MKLSVPFTVSNEERRAIAWYAYKEDRLATRVECQRFFQMSGSASLTDANAALEKHNRPQDDQYEGDEN